MVKSLQPQHGNTSLINYALSLENVPQVQSFADNFPFNGFENHDVFDLSSADEGEISLGQKAKSFSYGLVLPFITMCKSPKNIALTGLGFSGVWLALSATGGAIAPVLVTMGVFGATAQFLPGYNQAKYAENDSAAKKGWTTMGSGVTSFGLSVCGAKSSNASFNPKASDKWLVSVVECFKSTPKAVFKSVKEVFGANLLSNIKSSALFSLKDRRLFSSVDSNSVSDQKLIKANLYNASGVMDELLAFKVIEKYSFGMPSESKDEDSKRLKAYYNVPIEKIKRIKQTPD